MEFGTIFWVVVILAIPAMFIYKCIEAGVDASKNPDKYEIDAIFETNSRHYYKGSCMVCFTIRYKDGHAQDEWVDVAGLKYQKYKNWNNH